MNTAVVSRPGVFREPPETVRIGPATHDRTDAAVTLPAPEAVVASPASTDVPVPRATIAPDTAARQPNAGALRTALALGAVAVAVATWLAVASFARAAEPELVVLLRGMAALKGLLALGAAGLVGWRVGHPVSTPVAATYIACVWVLFACTALIGQLAFLPAAAVLFHAALLVALVVAWREGRRLPRFGRPARPSGIAEPTR